MQTLLIIVLALSLSNIIWTYFGYFAFLKLLAIIRPAAKAPKDEWFPAVSMIITAYNEEKRIGPKIENSLSLDYPADKLEIIVVSDGSTDRTVEIVKDYRNGGVKLLHFNERNGKHYCQGKGIESAAHDLLVLTDATTFLRQDAIRKIVRSFADPKIGVVSGMDAVEGVDGAEQGENFYVRYEMALRRLESRVASIVGASGSFYAVRKTVCRKWYPYMSSDFYLPLLARTYGYRSVLDEEAIGFYRTLDDPKREFKRKVRTIVHGLDVVYHLRYILNPFRYGMLSFQVLSHKVARWLVPFALLAAMAASVSLAMMNPLWLPLVIIQTVLYMLAALAAVFKPLQKQIVFKIPYFFVMANVSILVAWIEFIKGEKYITWQSTTR